jgi:hypothetical protein
VQGLLGTLNVEDLPNFKNPTGRPSFATLTVQLN